MDREKVIKGIIHHKLRHKSTDELNHDECFDCPYRPNGKSMCDSIEPMLDDILELLKEQEAVEPEWSKGTPFCGNCGYRLEKKNRNMDGCKCPNCERAVKWV